MNSYFCLECDKTFATKAKLESHKKTHKKKMCLKKERVRSRRVSDRNDVHNTHFEKITHKKYLSVKDIGIKSLKCQFCDKVFMYESQLSRHEAIHIRDTHQNREQCHKLSDGEPRQPIQKQKDKALICPVCGKDLAEGSKLKTHLKSCAHNNYSLKVGGNGDCTVQIPSSMEQNKSSSFQKLAVINKPDHVIKSEIDTEIDKAKSRTCQLCGKLFARSANLMLHMRLHRGDKPFKCSTCGKKFCRADHLKRHQLIHIRKEAYECSLCSNRFKRKDQLKYHQINSHGAKIYLSELKSYRRTGQDDEQTKLILCDICGASFGSERNLKCHVRIHSNQGKFSCQFCGKSFNQSSNLNIHLRKHTGETPYKCLHCDQSFATSAKLKTHARKHTGDLPFACDICGRLFGESHLLKMHKRIHNNLRLYQCSHCNKKFTHSSTLRAHVRTHTGAKPYKCDQCGDAFAQISSLTYHRRTHSGEKPYSCHICGNSYTRMATLNIHLTRHTGQKRISCQSCDFKCDTLKHLRKHIGKAHGHLTTTIDLLFQANLERPGVLYEDNVLSSVSESTPSASSNTMNTSNTFNQCTDHIQEHPYETPTSWNNDYSLSTPEDLLINNSCINNTATSHHFPSKAGETVTNVIKETFSVGNKGTIHSNIPYVCGLMVTLPHGPGYSDPSMLVSTSFNSTQEQSPSAQSSYPLDHPTSDIECSQSNFIDSAHLTMTHQIPQEVFSSSTIQNIIPSAIQNIINPEQKEVIHTSCLEKAVSCQPSDTDMLSNLSQPCLADNHLNAHVPQPAQPSTLKYNMYTTSVSSLNPESAKHLEIGAGVNLKEEVIIKIPTVQKGHCKDTGRDKVEALKDVAKGETHHEDINNKLKVEEESKPKNQTNVKKRKKRISPQINVTRSKTEKSNFVQTSKNQKSKSSTKCKRKKKLSLTKQKSRKLSHTSLNLTSKDAVKPVKKRMKRSKCSIKCETCGQSFSRMGNMTTHMRLHSGERPYSCKICDKKYTRSDHLKAHMILHKGGSSLVCNHCGDVFSSKDQLKLHTVDRHDGKNPFACNVCNFSCIYIKELKDHVKGHNEKESFVCDLCGISFLRTKDLKKHMMSHDRQHAFVCHTCEKSFRESSCLKLHMMTKHTGEKYFKCGICEETYVSAAKLQRHMRSHTGSRPYACEFCGKMFIDTCLLKMHVRIHTNEKRYKCEHCEQCFTHPSTLRAHVRIHTGLKPYTCEICGASFTQVSSLTYHKRRHNGLKPFTCHVCGNSYTRSTTLNIHMTRHTGLKRLSCTYCAFKCDRPKHLRKHLSKVHSGQVKVEDQEKEKQEKTSNTEQDWSSQNCLQMKENLSEPCLVESQKQLQPQEQLHLQQLQPEQPQQMLLPPQLTAPQILFLPQLQQGFLVAEPLQQPQHPLGQHLFIHHQKPHVTIQQIQPVLVPHHQQHQQQIYQTTSGVFQSIMASNSPELVQRNVIITPSNSLNHTC